MNYKFCADVKDNNTLRASFNELVQRTFGFNFILWYEKGHWGNDYIPHVLVDNDGKVISNVSVNFMKFDMDGVIKNYIQLGTIMTDTDYRGQGLNKYLIERILEEYKDRVDGFYLFANDSVLKYYPKFGFKPCVQYEYSLSISRKTDKKKDKYIIKKVDMSHPDACDKLYHTIHKYDSMNMGNNPNDGFSMCDNLSLIQFWLAAEYGNNVYYLPELEAYVIASISDGILKVFQIVSTHKVDIEKMASSFEDDISNVELYYTPIEKEAYQVKIHKEECTLFILGESLEKVETDKLLFPILSHA